MRLPLAEFALAAALADRGVAADFDVIDLDLHSLTLSNVHVGQREAPDIAIDTVNVAWAWNGLMPQLDAVQLTAPRLRLRVDDDGRVSAGALDHFERGSPSRHRPTIPRITLEITQGAVEMEAPFGDLTATVEGAGTLGENFSAVARFVEATRPGSDYALDRGAGELTVSSALGQLNFRLGARAALLLWSGARVQGVEITGNGVLPLDLEHFRFDATWRAAGLQVGDSGANGLVATLSAEVQMRDDAAAMASVNGNAQARAQRLEVGDALMIDVRAEARGAMNGDTGNGHWTLSAARFAGFAIQSTRLAASGRVFLADTGAMSGGALATFADASLDDASQVRIRSAFVNAPGAPIGPTFAHAERALDSAADNFDLSLPISFSRDAGVTRLSVAQPAQALAATGARLRLGPLRQDAPALTLTWPQGADEPVLSGAVALELSGGDAPSATLLLDTLSWTSGAPFETDGTLTLANWSAEGASIAAEELGVTIEARSDRGRVDVRGPLRITGPLGDGDVRALDVALDIAATWSDGGWRVAPNDACLPVRVGGLDAAGLSFSGGAFSLCPLGGALIAANRAQNLTGGFAIERLALNGRMAGPIAQHARLSASNIVGRFHGRASDVALTLEAGAPRLAIEMAPERTLSVTMRRVTAEARFAETWGLEGRFEAGVLTDPALPGTVSTIEGGWSAGPEDGQAVVRVTAGEALLTANRPATDADRPLFHPLRLVGIDALLRNGRVDAGGAVVLQDGARQLARFTAEHEVSEGMGSARVVSERIEFSEALQPYDITEQARGMVENVRGPAGVVADITWTRDTITGVARMSLHGLSLATATIPIVNDVRGEVFFNDAFALTTPPGQEVTIGTLDPGVAVHNGRVRFQLLQDQQVSIESAAFDFAGGALAMAPTTITLGADETRFELRLRGVDAAELLATLKVPDLAATGRVEGEFPLLLTRRTAFIRNGVLRAEPEGGLISYTGDAGRSATGPARLAFDALRSFRYDDLSLTLDGDLNGEVISSIAFSGENRGEAIDLGSISQVPGIGRVTVRGVPFDFNVRVTAPFRSLAQTAASIADPGSLIRQAQDTEEEQVDAPPDPPR